MDQASSPKLASMVTTVTMDGQRRVKPSDCFIEKAQTTSSTPAIMRASHATAAASFTQSCRAVPDLDPWKGGGRCLAGVQMGAHRGKSTTARPAAPSFHQRRKRPSLGGKTLIQLKPRGRPSALRRQLVQRVDDGHQVVDELVALA